MKLKKGDWVIFACGGKAQVEDIEGRAVQFAGFDDLLDISNLGECIQSDMLNILEVTQCP